MEVHELATIVEAGFKDLAGRIDQTNARIDQTNMRLDSRIDEVGARLDSRIDEVGVRLDAHIDQLGVRLDGRIDEVGARLTGVADHVARLDDKLHQTNIQVEGLYGQIELVAEGIDNLNQKMDRHIVESDRQYDDVRSVILAARRI